MPIPSSISTTITLSQSCINKFEWIAGCECKPGLRQIGNTTTCKRWWLYIAPPESGKHCVRECLLIRFTNISIFRSTVSLLPMISTRSSWFIIVEWYNMINPMYMLIRWRCFPIQIWCEFVQWCIVWQPNYTGSLFFHWSARILCNHWAFSTRYALAQFQQQYILTRKIIHHYRANPFHDFFYVNLQH